MAGLCALRALPVQGNGAPAAGDARAKAVSYFGLRFSALGLTSGFEPRDSLAPGISRFLQF